MVLILISSETHLGLAPMKMTILCCHGILRPARCQTKEIKDLKFFSWQLHVLPLFFTTRECCEKHRLQVLEAGSKEVQILRLPQWWNTPGPQQQVQHWKHTEICPWCITTTPRAYCRTSLQKHTHTLQLILYETTQSSRRQRDKPEHTHSWSVPNSPSHCAWTWQNIWYMLQRSSTHVFCATPFSHNSLGPDVHCTWDCMNRHSQVFHNETSEHHSDHTQTWWIHNWQHVACCWSTAAASCHSL